MTQQRDWVLHDPTASAMEGGGRKGGSLNESCMTQVLCDSTNRAYCRTKKSCMSL